MIDKFLETHITTTAQYSFEFRVLSTPSKIVAASLFCHLCIDTDECVKHTGVGACPQESFEILML